MKSGPLTLTKRVLTGILHAPEPPLSNKFLDPANNHDLLRYSQALRKKYLYTNNFGLALDDSDLNTTGRPVPLNNLFVPPLVSRQPYTPEDILLQEKDAKEHRLLEVHQVLRHNPRLFLLGTPGTGKTTLVHWLLLALTYSGMNHVKVALGQVVPFAFILRDLTLREVHTWEDLWRRLVESTGVDIEPALLNTLFQSGQAFFLLDGLDEVADPLVRKGLGLALLDGMNRYRRCRFLVTSRLIGFSAAAFFGLDEVAVTEEGSENFEGSSWGPEHLFLLGQKMAMAPGGSRDTIAGENTSGFGTAFLAPFNTSQVKRFAVNWFSQYEPDTFVHMQRVDDLMDRVGANQGLSRLSRIPVLLNMICFIHARRTRLPDGRVELYERIAQTYLVALDRAKGLELPGKDLNIDYQDLSNWLATLALTMQERRIGEKGAVQVDRKEIERILSQGLEEKGLSEQECGCQCQAILRYFIRRSGFLVPVGQRQGEEVYAFNHLSFQEYFAARALDEKISFFTTEKEWREIRTLLDQPHWQETFVLLFEMQPSVRKADHLADRLFGGRNENAGESKGSKILGKDLVPVWLVMAQVAMDTAVRLGREQRGRLIERAWGAVKPYLLGHHLPSSRGLLASKLPEHVRKVTTFLLHDQFASLDCLKELVSGQSRLILPNVDIPNPAVLQDFTSLTELDLSGTSISDIRPLARLIQLTTLDLSGTSISDIRPLAQLTQLTGLDLSRTSISDIRPLAQLTQLTTLDLSGTSISDIRPLAQLTQLTGLDLSRTSISDIRPLAQLTRLIRLYLSGTSVSDISPLASLTGLTGLQLSGPSIGDISLLAQLTRLTTLFLSGPSISDIRPLARLTRLTRLFLRGTSISDIRPLARLTRLTWLELNGTSISDIRPLAQLTSLTRLDLSGTSVRDITPLAHLGNLTITQ